VSALDRFFDCPAYHRGELENNWQIVQWWERRRLHFNAVLAVVGTITVMLMLACTVVANALPDPPIFMPLGIIAYAVMANVCYTGGWIAELLVRTWMLPDDSCSFGLRTFRRGMKFSICLTLFPALLSWAVFLFSLGVSKIPR
jgi:hypothetical protein